jgi:hypothetical protein
MRARVDVMEKIHKLILLVTGKLITSNLWAVSRLGLYGHITYFMFGITNILVIG